MGLIISVYRNAEFAGQDFTLNGISNRFSRLLLVNVAGPFNPEQHTNAAPAMLETHHKGCLRIVEAVNIAKPGEPACWRKRPGWCQDGGNYAATSDSRFSEACERLTGQPWYGAVAIHDRYES
jgi:hypothetical protein